MVKLKKKKSKKRASGIGMRTFLLCCMGIALALLFIHYLHLPIPKKHNKIARAKMLAQAQIAPDNNNTVEFEFYSTLPNTHVKVPKPPKSNISPQKRVIEAEDLENDVLKHIK